METSNARPMLGSLTADRWGAEHRRNDKPVNAAYRRIQIRQARHSETLMIAADLADERAAIIELAQPGDIDNDWASFLADVNRDADLLNNGCYTDLDDDNEAQVFTAYGLDTATYDDLLDQITDDLDLPDPWGTTFDPDDIQWGFRVTALDKAPGVTSGRPQPAALVTW